MEIDHWSEWILRRNPKKSRHHTFYRNLDSAFPSWESILGMPAFDKWANYRHPVTGKTRADILQLLSMENFDGVSTARLLKIAPQEMKILREQGAMYTEHENFLGIGSIIDKRYEVIHPLGIGGFGIVTLVYSHEVEEFFALKMIKSEFLSEPVSRAQFIKEANLWVNLGKHRNIVRAEIIDTLGSEIVILMEPVDGDENGNVSLQHHISNRTDISLEEIALWSSGICQGMSHAYTTGIRAHRDLKPDNVLINKGVAKVTDFGISSLIQPFSTVSNVGGKEVHLDRTNAYTILGTLPYMSPEQFRDAHSCNEKSDIYSFGVILYKLLSNGMWPYGDLDNILRNVEARHIPATLYNLHKSEKPKRQSHRLFDIALQCLETRQENRPTSFRHVENLILDRTKDKVSLKEPETIGEHFDPWVAGQEAKNLMRLGRYEEALEILDRVIKSIPLIKAEFDKALILSRLGRNEEAIALYSKILQKEPDHLGALVNQGLLYDELGYPDRALELYNKAHKAHPSDRSVMTNIGNLAYKKRNYRLAARYYKKTVEDDEGYATGWYNLGLALDALDLLTQSRNSFANFLACSDPIDARRKLASEKIGKNTD